MTLLKRFRALYGAGPLNLLVLLVSFAIAGLAVAGWFQRPRDVETVIIWFAAAIVLHDLVVLPLYSLLDRIAFGGRRGRDRGARGQTVLGLVGSTPYVRIPAILSGLLLIVFFPVILGLGSQTELSASGIAESGYLARWLIASGVIFALSGVAWAVALRRGAARVRASRRPAPRRGPPPTPASDPRPAPAPDPRPAPPRAPASDPRPAPPGAPGHEPADEGAPDADATTPAPPPSE